MPQVPVIAENRERLTPLSGARFDAPDIGAGGRILGEGLRRGARGVQEAAKDLDDLDLMYAEARAKKLDVEYQEFRREALYGEDGYFVKSNADALDARKPTEEALTKKRAELLAKTQDPRERSMLEGVLSRRWQEDAEGIAKFAQGQAKAFAGEQINSRIRVATDNYATVYETNREQAEAEKATVLSEVSRAADLNGWNDPNIIASKRAEALTDLHKGYVEGAMMRDPTLAAAYLEEHRGEITQDVELDLDAKLNPLLLDRDAREFASMAVGLATPGEVAEVDTGEGKEPVVLALPVRGASVSSGYGMRKHPIDGKAKHHDGLDIKGALGAPVGAAGDGKVVFVGDRNDGYGNRVEIDHGNGYVTSYSHLQNGSFKVKVGQRVGRGARIASVGSTGRSTGPHLHFEVARDDGTTYGKRIDPRSVVGKELAPATGGGGQGGGQGDLASQLEWAETYIPEKLAGKPPLYVQNVVDRTKAEIRRKHGEERAAQREAEGQQYDAALEQAFALGEAFTDITQINGWQNLPPSNKITLRNWAKSNARAAAAGTKPETDWAYYADLQTKTPEQLRAINPAEARARLDDTEFKEFANERGKKEKEPGKALAHTDILAVTKMSLGAAGYAVGESKQGRRDAPKVQEFLRDMTNWAKGVHQQTGKWPESDAIRRQGDRFLLEGFYKDASGEWVAGRAFERPDGAKFLPKKDDATRQRIVREFTAEMGRAPTPREINEIFIANTGILW